MRECVDSIEFQIVYWIKFFHLSLESFKEITLLKISAFICMHIKNYVAWLWFSIFFSFSSLDYILTLYTWIKMEIQMNEEKKKKNWCEGQPTQRKMRLTVFMQIELILCRCKDEKFAEHTNGVSWQKANIVSSLYSLT